MRTALQNLDGAAAKKQLDDTGSLTLTLSDGEVSLTAEEVLIDTAQKEGFTSVSDRGLTVVLDTTLTPELEEEGFVRGDRQQAPVHAQGRGLPRHRPH